MDKLLAELKYYSEANTKAMIIDEHSVGYLLSYNSSFWHNDACFSHRFKRITTRYKSYHYLNLHHIDDTVAIDGCGMTLTALLAATKVNVITAAKINLAYYYRAIDLDYMANADLIRAMQQASRETNKQDLFILNDIGAQLTKPCAQSTTTSRATLSKTKPQISSAVTSIKSSTHTSHEHDIILLDDIAKSTITSVTESQCADINSSNTMHRAKPLQTDHNDSSVDRSDDDTAWADSLIDLEQSDYDLYGALDQTAPFDLDLDELDETMACDNDIYGNGFKGDLNDIVDIYQRDRVFNPTAASSRSSKPKSTRSKAQKLSDFVPHTSQSAKTTATKSQAANNQVSDSQAEIKQLQNEQVLSCLERLKQRSQDKSKDLQLRRSKLNALKKAEIKERHKNITSSWLEQLVHDDKTDTSLDLMPEPKEDKATVQVSKLDSKIDFAKIQSKECHNYKEHIAELKKEQELNKLESLLQDKNNTSDDDDDFEL